MAFSLSGTLILMKDAISTNCALHVQGTVDSCRLCIYLRWLEKSIVRVAV